MTGPTTLPPLPPVPLAFPGTPPSPADLGVIPTVTDPSLAPLAAPGPDSTRDNAMNAALDSPALAARVLAPFDALPRTDDGEAGDPIFDPALVQSEAPALPVDPSGTPEPAAATWEVAIGAFILDAGFKASTAKAYRTALRNAMRPWLTLPTTMVPDAAAVGGVLAGTTVSRIRQTTMASAYRAFVVWCRAAGVADLPPLVTQRARVVPGTAVQAFLARARATMALRSPTNPLTGETAVPPAVLHPPAGTPPDPPIEAAFNAFLTSIREHPSFKGDIGFVPRLRGIDARRMGSTVFLPANARSTIFTPANDAVRARLDAVLARDPNELLFPGCTP